MIGELPVLIPGLRPTIPTKGTVVGKLVPRNGEAYPITLVEVVRGEGGDQRNILGSLQIILPVTQEAIELTADVDADRTVNIRIKGVSCPNIVTVQLNNFKPEANGKRRLRYHLVSKSGVMG